MTTGTEYAKAFNAGCDARLAGLRDTQNPHDDSTLNVAWQLGWWDVERHWGELSRGAVKKLPEVNRRTA